MEHPPAANGILRDEMNALESAGPNGGPGDRSPLSETGKVGLAESSSGHEENEPRRQSNQPVRDSDYPKRVSVQYGSFLPFLFSL